MFPDNRTYFEIDPEAKDYSGLPVRRFHWHWTDQEVDKRSLSATEMGVTEFADEKIGAAPTLRTKARNTSAMLATYHSPPSMARPPTC